MQKKYIIETTGTGEAIFDYTFLRNRVPDDASDFSLFMAKRFGARIRLGNPYARAFIVDSKGA